MEKLIELLNEYAPEDFNWCEINGKIFDKSYEFGDTPVNFEMGVYVISKQFGFIKWLDEKDKIDRPKVWLKIKDLGDEYGWFGIYSGIHIECLLMLLAIQDEPINCLTSVLK